MNRQINNSTKGVVRNNCANYQTGFICSGCMIGNKLEQWIDTDKAGKKCLIINGNKCDYYDKCIKPIID